MRALTAAVTAGSLVLGFAVAQLSGVRALGGVVLVLAGLWCARLWWLLSGKRAMWVLGLTYFAVFVLSHPLGHLIGTWPAVLTVAAVAGAASYALTRPRSALLSVQ
ncbi:MAG TPA: hypothetical protein VIM19_01420 [Actinomycetes bacterium]